MSYSGIAPGYAQPPGPGGVFNAFGEPQASPQLSPSTLTGYFVSGSWSSGRLLSGVLVSRPIITGTKPGEPAVDWVAARCAEGKQVFAHVSSTGSINGVPTIGYGLMATSDPGVISLVNSNWAPGEDPMTEIACPAVACPSGMIEVPGGGCQLAPTAELPPVVDSDKLAKQMMVGGLVITGVALAGFYLFTRKR